jgi:hypothetical protein
MRARHLTALALTTLLVACGEPSSDDASNAGGSSAGGTTTSTSSSSSATSGAGGGATTGSGGSSASTTFAEMCAKPGVLFCEAFEGGWDASWIEDNGDVTLVPDSAVPGEGTSVVELKTYAGKQSSKLLRTFPEADDVYVRFDVQYATDYDNSGGSHGPILGGSSSPPWGMYGTAGIKPNGSDFFVNNFEPKGVVGSGGEFHFYSYFVNMKQSGDGNYWGNGFNSMIQPPPLVTPGVWQCVEERVVLNTPGNNTDGTAEFWVDGVVQGSFTGIQWRTNADLHISTFALDSYNHFNNGPVPQSQPNRVRYDNIVISTAPIGCLTTP